MSIKEKITNNVKIKNTIITLMIILVIISTIVITYSYFSSKSEQITDEITTENLDITFVGGDIVRAEGLKPITNDKIEEEATELPFTITNNNHSDVIIDIKLKDIVISEELKNENFRWGLFNQDTGLAVSRGIFSDVTSVMDILTDSILDMGATKNYVLKIWIHENNKNQIEMAGKTLEGKIEVRARTFEYTKASCFTVSNNQITGYDAETCGTDVIIPKVINDRNITIIGGFSSKGLTSVIIPSGVTAVEGLGGNQLAHITIPEGVK